MFSRYNRGVPFYNRVGVPMVFMLWIMDQIYTNYSTFLNIT